MLWWQLLQRRVHNAGSVRNVLRGSHKFAGKNKRTFFSQTVAVTWHTYPVAKSFTDHMYPMRVYYRISMVQLRQGSASQNALCITFLVIVSVKSPKIQWDKHQQVLICFQRVFIDAHAHNTSLAPRTDSNWSAPTTVQNGITERRRVLPTLLIRTFSVKVPVVQHVQMNILSKVKALSSAQT